MRQYLNKLTDAQALSLVAKVEEPFAKLPHLPQGVINFLVTVAPWLVGLGGLFSLLGGISSILNSNNMAMWGWVSPLIQVNPTYFILTGIVSILVGILELLAFSPLRRQELEGWMYLFWATMLGIVQSIIGIAFGFGNIVGIVIGTLIGFYILFEVKKEYKK